MNSLRKGEQENLRLGINEPTLVPSIQEWLVMKVLPLQNRKGCQVEINDWPSLNHSYA
jgi:hypothetical protein